MLSASRRACSPTMTRARRRLAGGSTRRSSSVGGCSCPMTEIDTSLTTLSLLRREAADVLEGPVAVRMVEVWGSVMLLVVVVVVMRAVLLPSSVFRFYRLRSMLYEMQRGASETSLPYVRDSQDLRCGRRAAQPKPAERCMRKTPGPPVSSVSRLQPPPAFSLSLAHSLNFARSTHPRVVKRLSPPTHQP